MHVLRLLFISLLEGLVLAGPTDRRSIRQWTQLGFNNLTNDTSTSYAVQEPPLDTPWTYEVGTNPWPEYPRPQLQRSDWQNLNGLWRYRNASSADEAPPFGATLPHEVLVPSCLESALSGLTHMIFDLDPTK